ncbi:carbohydrate kinase family protein [Denitratisoma sp. DHT3]|uniref:carbohydrate kinase family protein n=1 Tax=Denitratisoma sp. DHT3 TaxID=1981880 RepID=UPI0011987DA3|nr:carbohydrate kinase family protein [Denitratisoma sp. DHT3]QDX81606.1 carbohydrate kinase family protein [Denitratisoma sp. DHT3]
MPAIICGSFAYDNIMSFHDRFKSHILPDKIHMLNVSFLVPAMRREFGGCAGNIAYNLMLLGDQPLPVGTVGKDFEPYREWLQDLGIDSRHVMTLDDCYTAQAFITTDMDDNQITAFHPGAMSHAHRNNLKDIQRGRIGIVSPDGKEGMVEHARQFAELGTPFIFDPGQGMPMFNGEELRDVIAKSTWVTVNDYEWQLMQDRTGWKAVDVLRNAEALIVTLGGQGSVIHTRDKTYEIPPAKVSAINDPTGCGDAYRAGLLHGLLHGMDWEITGRIAGLMGAIKIESPGTQNHRFTVPEFKARFRETYRISND